MALRVSNGTKSYLKGSYILKDLNMSVRRGEIYGLLGASGCGKTTLLSCVVGLRQLDRGDLIVFGQQRNGHLGQLCGYMPQEISLLNVFTINEALYHFGLIYGMSGKAIENRIDFLASFLDLPDRSAQIQYLSGGQKRRVSLAVVMIHNPPLLVLDEPTVGLDPTLRQRIWEHLFDLSRTRGTTMIISTHYIEECKRCDKVVVCTILIFPWISACALKVGFMRGGQLLAEDTPNALLTMYGEVSLEGVALRLCRLHESRPSTNADVRNDKKPLSTDPDKIFGDEKTGVVKAKFYRKLSFASHDDVVHSPVNVETNHLSILCALVLKAWRRRKRDWSEDPDGHFQSQEGPPPSGCGFLEFWLTLTTPQSGCGFLALWLPVTTPQSGGGFARFRNYVIEVSRAWTFQSPAPPSPVQKPISKAQARPGPEKLSPGPPKPIGLFVKKARPGPGPPGYPLGFLSTLAQARLGKSPPRPGPTQFGSSKAQARPSPVAGRPARPSPVAGRPAQSPMGLGGPGLAHLKPRPGSLLLITYFMIPSKAPKTTPTFGNLPVTVPKAREATPTLGCGYWFIFSELLMPLVVIIVLQNVVGLEPRNIGVSLVTGIPNLTNNAQLEKYCDSQRSNKSSPCLENLGICDFLGTFKPYELDWLVTDSWENGLNNIRAGRSAALVEFPQNYTNHMTNWALDKNYVSNETIHGTTISIRMDESSVITATWMKHLIATNYFKYLGAMATACGVSKTSVELAVYFNAIYGGLGIESIIRFSEPAMLVMLMLFLSQSAGVVWIVDRSEGLEDRDYAAGVTLLHRLVASMVADSIKIVVQLIVFVTLLTAGYGMRVQGSWALMLGLIYLASVEGLAIGWMLGTLRDDALEAIILVLCLFSTQASSSGLFLPLELSPDYVRQYFSHWLPATYPNEAMRSITSRGWGLENFYVTRGFITGLGWTLLCILIVLLAESRKHK
ncbi:ABC transporter G family member 23 [Folsomia candida]|uniref:ABC transporter G family member 23 n=1 Tax=Folsomia candida TaxID=158441 RepID=A0A226DP33_FOLCA|nr:ABC transporter G family member 23 [Folsomia candida]